MCLNLMQVEILAKIAYIGKCFGLGEKETEKESDELVDETDKSGEAEEDGDYSMDVGEPAAFDNYAYQTE